MNIALVRDAQGRPQIDDPRMVKTFYNARVERQKKDREGKPVLENGRPVIELVSLTNDSDRAHMRAMFPRELKEEIDRDGNV